MDNPDEYEKKNHWEYTATPTAPEAPKKEIPVQPTEQSVRSEFIHDVSSNQAPPVIEAAQTPLEDVSKEESKPNVSVAEELERSFNKPVSVEVKKEENKVDGGEEKENKVKGGV